MTPDSTKKAIAKIGKYFMKVKTKTKARGSLPIQIVLNDTGKALIDIFKYPITVTMMDKEQKKCSGSEGVVV